MGNLTDFNLWRTSLPLEQLQRWTSCEEHSKGNMLTWGNGLAWRITNMEMKEETQESICSPPSPGLVAVPSPLPYTPSLLLCKALGGFPASASTEELRRQFLALHTGQVRVNCTDYFWGGFTDKDSEGR